jgi:ribosomal protein S18 acetylase RimI-like enzyme
VVIVISKLKRQVAAVREARSTYGTIAALQYVVDFVGHKLVGLTVVRLVWLDVARLAPQDPVTGFDCRFLDPEEIRSFSSDPTNDLSGEMADRAAGLRDLCFASVSKENGRLAAYGWYALECIEPEHNVGVAMSYPSDVAHMYKGFTHPNFRGKRLHGVLMAMALRELGSRGVTKLVSVVSWTNWPSLRSCDRLGYVVLGTIVVLDPGGRLILHVPSAGKRLGVRFGSRAEKRRGASG